MATPSAAEITYQETHLGDDRRATIIVPNVVFIVAAMVAVILRFESRRIARIELKADDWWIAGGLILTTAFIISYSMSVKYGMGKHAILITDAKGFTITAICGEAFYNVSIIAIKPPTPSLYRRIFPQSWFKRVLIVLGGFVVAYSLTQLCVDIFQCVPISSAWDRSENAKCVPFGSFIMTMCIINIVTDVIMLVLPMPLLWKLRVSTPRRWMLMIMFSFGGLVCVISIVRLFYVRKVGSTDPSYDDVDSATISAVECCVGIICACLPTYRPLWNRYGGGSSNERVTKDTSKAHGSKPTELKHLKSSENRSWGNFNDNDGIANHEGPYTRLGTVTDIESQWKAGAPVVANRDILVTKGIASSESGY
ncbi:hypothetical protein N7G274_009242 [Stereocaulon virgatum]|uniref:Rhodopsin domain-containing protein n=1 Tax=Stereocaulon virgatum TaxID=373712 RepID=A0ABR3ZWK5_9LECA